MALVEVKHARISKRDRYIEANLCDRFVRFTHTHSEEGATWLASVEDYPVVGHRFYDLFEVVSVAYFSSLRHGNELMWEKILIDYGFKPMTREATKPYHYDIDEKILADRRKREDDALKEVHVFNPEGL